MDNRSAVRVPFGWLPQGGDGAPPSTAPAARRRASFFPEWSGAPPVAEL